MTNRLDVTKMQAVKGSRIGARGFNAIHYGDRGERKGEQKTRGGYSGKSDRGPGKLMGSGTY